MRRMTKADRLAFFNAGTSAAVHAGEIQCDDCDERAVAPTHHGNPDSVVCHCAKHFKAYIAHLRTIRPTREQLVARVNAAIART